MYICPLTEYIRVAFMRGGQLPDADSLLQDHGKRLCHVGLRTQAEMKRPAVKGLLREAEKTAQALPRKCGV